MAPGKLKIAVIADDLTGSLDTGLQFRKRGLETVVPLKPGGKYPKAEALVINTDTRNLPGEQAYRRVYGLCRRVSCPAIYKKIDSTMRGNVGREALAILDSAKIPKAVIVPTVPQQGRTVERGILRVRGVPLLGTAYARDPFRPLTSSNVRVLLEKDSPDVGLIALSDVRRGAVWLSEKIRENQARLLAIDAVTQSDLHAIALACRSLPWPVLPCGSVGLAEEVAPPEKKGPAVKRRSAPGPVLVVAASRNPATGEQIREAIARSGLHLIEPDLGAPGSPWKEKREIDSISRQAGAFLAEGNGGVILSTTFQTHRAGREKIIPRFLGKAAVHLLRNYRVGGLVLTGGDLAMGVCRLLSSSALRIEEEVLPGIPCSTLTDGPFKGLPLVTKAGGFGEKDALWKIIRYLKCDSTGA
ncbi:MAG TPA: four-carbon acid sugar kinase family protein [Thermodesulfobacteriota bacterium]|nr:four-carbon acid sugar kinase family protein [Thermodesulfobacteriota bacterium]